MHYKETGFTDVNLIQLVQSMEGICGHNIYPSGSRESGKHIDQVRD
jgi:hypothetical protein